MQITIYTDGACDIHAENRPGGWAAIIRASGEQGELIDETVLSGGEEHTTNNRMELRAVIEGLKSLRQPAQATVVTDSRYVIDVAKGTNRIHQNRDLWREYFAAKALHTVEWRFVRGHSGDEHNGRCDWLAVSERKKIAAASKAANRPLAPPPEETDSLAQSMSVKADLRPDRKSDDSTIRAYLATKTSTKHAEAAWVAYIVDYNRTTILGGVLPDAERYELSLIGAIETVEFLAKSGAARIYTSNSTLANGANAWVKQWAQNNWMYLSGKEERPVRHKALWQELQRLMKDREITFEYSKEIRQDETYKWARSIASSLLKQSRLEQT